MKELDSEFALRQFMTESDWRKREHIVALSLCVLGFLCLMLGTWVSTALREYLITALMTLGFTASGLASLYSSSYRVALNGGWPLDSLRRNRRMLEDAWLHMFPGITLTDGEVRTWAALKSKRFCLGLVPVLVQDTESLVRRRCFLVAHYDLLRRSRSKVLRAWQPLRLVVDADDGALIQQLKDLDVSIEQAVRAEYESISFWMGPDPLLFEPLKTIWPTQYALTQASDAVEKTLNFFDR